jgi:transcriptional regulator with GAF, ATPase, and Fis domain
MSESVTHHTVVVRGSLGEPERLRRAYYKITSGRGREQLAYRGSDDIVTIGSHPSNQLVLPQATVSRFHARLELDSTGYKLIDLESTNGTFVGGLRVGSAYITHKAKLRFGDVDAYFEVERAEAELGLGAGESWGALIGKSPVMRRIFEQLQQVAATESTLLLHGETGVGKDLIAEEVHHHSQRAGRPFVVVDCGALPGNLIDSELFGHERGAFTGADTARAGAFEEADGGTLFLDEIGELPLPMQVRLLRAIEERKVKRVGSDRWTPVDVRVIAATHRDLPRMCNQRLFREDLYYRIAVVALRIPPLRERPEDIPLLVASFLRDAGANAALDPSLIEALTRRRWAGNVRELRNLVERALALGPAALDEQLDGDSPAQNADGAEEPYKVQKARAVEAFERSYLESLLTRHRGNVAQAARAGEIDPAWIFRLIKRYGLDAASFRKR